MLCNFRVIHSLFCTSAASLEHAVHDEVLSHKKHNKNSDKIKQYQMGETYLSVQAQCLFSIKTERLGGLGKLALNVFH